MTISVAGVSAVTKSWRGACRPHHGWLHQWKSTWGSVWQYHWPDSIRQREGCVVRHTFVTSAVCLSAMAVIGSAVGLAAGQQASGSSAQKPWAFTLPVQAPPPNAAADLDNPIDRFLDRTRTDKGLRAAPRASRQTLLRRAYLDLIG